jgi:hypothetical protein
MIEHAIKDQTQAATVHLLDQPVEVGLIAKPAVDLEVICRVVAMGGRREDRRQQQAGDAEVDRIIEPGADLAEPVPDLGARRRLAFGADKAERINLPEDGVFDEVSQLSFP